ncbi:MAG: nucleotide exchange factor GrpE [Candidatus Bathyarchaeia archaeon]
MPCKESQEENLDERLEELKSRLEEVEKEAETYLNQLKYARADLENLQKQTQRRIDDVVKRANGRLLEQLLPIMDELELAVETAKNTESGILDGLQMIKNKLQNLLEREGVKPIDAEGKKFDPYHHEALVEVHDSDKPDGYIVEEIRKGYMYQGRVLRASLVKVSSNTEGEKEDE